MSSQNMSMKSFLLNKNSATTEDVTVQAREMYNDFRFGDFNYGNKREKFDQLLFRFLSMVDKDKKLFDIGCGAGYWLGTYVRLGIPKSNITGVDLAPDNIRELQNKGYKAVCENILDLRFENDSADFVMCNGVIDHTSDPFKAFSELVRITEPGGFIYLNVYNKWNPYFYLVHRAMFPLRFFYWNMSKKIIDFIYPVSALFFQPLAYLAMGKFLDEKTGKAFFMDQVITPKAEVFSKSEIRSYAQKLGCEVIEFKYNRYFLMLAAIIKVGSQKT